MIMEMNSDQQSYPHQSLPFVKKDNLEGLLTSSKVREPDLFRSLLTMTCVARPSVLESWEVVAVAVLPEF